MNMHLWYSLKIISKPVDIYQSGPEFLLLLLTIFDSFIVDILLIVICSSKTDLHVFVL